MSSKNISKSKQFNKITQNLKKMEEELGVSLFERSGRQLIPSQGGDSFYRHAKRILEEYRSSLSELSVIGEHLSFYYYAMPSSAIKDRVLAHNPVGALYQTGSYYSRLLEETL